MSNHCKPLGELTPEEREQMVRSSEEFRKRSEAYRQPMNPDRDLSWENTHFDGDSSDD